MSADADGAKDLGLAPMEEIAGLTGLEFLQGIVDGKYAQPGMGKTLNFRMVEVSKGIAIFEGHPGKAHLNPMGTVHGGYVSTLLDSALGCAAQTLCDRGFASTSVDLKVNMVRPIFPDTGRLICRAEIVHPGRQLTTVEGRVTDENGKLYAHGSQTCFVFKLPV